jgi:arsenate reductase
MTVLYHNPRCSKSRAAVALCEASNLDVEIHLYLVNPLTKQVLHDVLSRLDGPISAAIRRKDVKFKEADSSELDTESLDSVVEFLSNHGHLIERPLLDTGVISIIGRPLEHLEAHL